MEEAIIALVGTVVGFLLGWVKEVIESRPRLRIELKNGSLCYFNKESDSNMNIIKEKASPEVADELELNLVFDIFNIGKSGTGVTDISIKVMANNEKLYFQPKIILPLENRELDNISFNLESNKVCTIKAVLVLKNTHENSYIFNNINLLPGYSNSLNIEVVVNTIRNKKLLLSVEPISIYTA